MNDHDALNRAIALVARSLGHTSYSLDQAQISILDWTLKYLGGEYLGGGDPYYEQVTLLVRQVSC